jgi:hypothetical protein
MAEASGEGVRLGSDGDPWRSPAAAPNRIVQSVELPSAAPNSLTMVAPATRSTLGIDHSASLGAIAPARTMSSRPKSPDGACLRDASFARAASRMRACSTSLA